MLFNSSPYLVFLAVAVAAYWLLPVRFRRGLVLLASLLFYATWGFVFVWVPLAVAGIVHLIGKQIVSTAANARKWMWLGIGILLVPLILFKYNSYLHFNLNFVTTFLVVRHSSLATAIAFPAGISFFTFEAIAYLVDV